MALRQELTPARGIFRSDDEFKRRGFVGKAEGLSGAGVSVELKMGGQGQRHLGAGPTFKIEPF